MTVKRKTNWGKVTRCPNCNWYIGLRVLRAYKNVCPNCEQDMKPN